MNDAKFWRLIKAARSVNPIANGLEILEETLSKEDETAILQFLNIFRKKMNKALTEGVADTCYLLTGTLSDDDFEDFRAWLILQGKEIYTTCLQHPEALIHALDETQLANPKMETLLFLSHRAYALQQGVAVEDTSYLDCLLAFEEKEEVIKSMEPEDDAIMEVKNHSVLSKRYPQLYQWHMLNVEVPSEGIDLPLFWEKSQQIDEQPEIVQLTDSQILETSEVA